MRDFTADGGLVSLHSAPRVRIELAMEYVGDLDELATRVQDAGHDAVVVDEAYNRTLRLTPPDGAELWINGAQTDLYGFTEHR